MLHVVPHINQEASGPSYSVPRLCQSLAACDNQVELTCLAANGLVPGVVLDIHPQWPVANRFAISTSLTLSLSRKACLVDVVHNHSLWSMVNVAAGLVVPGKRAALVASPRGTLSDWALRRSGCCEAYFVAPSASSAIASRFAACHERSRTARDPRPGVHGPSCGIAQWN